MNHESLIATMIGGPHDGLIIERPDNTTVEFADGERYVAEDETLARFEWVQ